jgi:hypothetical protein
MAGCAAKNRQLFLAQSITIPNLAEFTEGRADLFVFITVKSLQPA